MHVCMCLVGAHLLVALPFEIADWAVVPETSSEAVCVYIYRYI